MSSPLVALALEQLTDHQIQRLLDALASISAPMRGRGRRYADSGMVGPPRITASTVSAHVRGTRRYTVVWSWNGKGWTGACSCPVSYRCKHLFALGSAVLAAWPGADGLPRTTRELIARVPVRWANLPELAAAGRRQDSNEVVPDDGDDGVDDFDDDETDEADTHDTYFDGTSPPPARESVRRVAMRVMREAHARARLVAAPPPAPPAPNFERMRAQGLAQVREGRSYYERERGFQLLWSRPDAGQPPRYHSGLLRVLESPEPDLRCLRLARLFPALADGWLPPELAPYLERSDLLERERELARQSLAAELRAWADKRTDVSDRTLRFVLGLTPDPERGWAFTLEPRLTTPRRQDVVQSEAQLQHLLREARGRPERLDPRTWSMLEGYLSSWAEWTREAWSHRKGFTANMLRRLLESGAGTPALVWDAQLALELAARFAITPGAPVAMGSGGASIVPVCVERNDAPALDLHVRWPDGRGLPLADGLLWSGEREGLARHADLLLIAGALHVLADAPAPGLVERFRALGPIALRPDDSGGLVTALSVAFPSLHDSLRPFTRVLHAEPVFALSLDSGDRLRVRLFAASAGAAWVPPHAPGEGVWVKECHPGLGWREHAGDDASNRAAAFELTGAERTEADTLPDVIADETPAEALAPGATDTGAPAREARSPRRIWFQSLDGAAIEPARAWLDHAGARAELAPAPGANPAPPGFVISLKGPGLARLAEALTTRPEGARWFATKDVRGMLEDAPVVRARLKVKSSGVDLLAISAEWEAEGRTLTEADYALLRQSGEALVRLSSGWARRAPRPELTEVENALADLGLEPGAGPQRITLWQLMQARPESLRTLESGGADAELMAAVARLREAVAEFKGIPAVAVPKGFTGELRPYQQRGVDFMAWTSSLALGAVLADDMGLGKTVQTLAWLLAMKQRTPRMGPALVVCPTSVIHNWRREAARFAPGLRVAVLESGEERHAVFAAARRHDLLITNFALLRLDIEKWRELKLGAVVVDEAQNIKNPDAAISEAVCALGARYRLALTGTPLENRALDLWSIMEFVNPGLLGTRAHFSAAYDRADAPLYRRRLLAARLRPVLLRRLKQDVARDLPDRIEERLDCELLPAQRRLYLAQLSNARDMVAALAAEPGGLKKHGIEILAALTRLRQICCHPALIGAPEKAGSGKFDAFWELLEPMLAEGRKVLVFSQFVRCLELLAENLKRRGLRHYMLTGATKKRDELVARFQADPEPCVFLISLKAGGTGLNLTAARDVVLFDPWWNPAVEAQAIDRTHRIGQDRTVIAYRLITRGTLEERILELQERKGALARDILGEGSLGRSITREDLDYLLAPE